MTKGLTTHLFKILFCLGALAFSLGCSSDSKKQIPKAIKVSSKKRISNSKLSEKEWLSEYNFFKKPLSDLQPKKGVFAYDLNNALFTDYAFKKRFIFLPDGKKMTYQNEGVLDFEIGSILIKNFYYPKDFNKPMDEIKIIETRLLIKEVDGWKPLNYVWNESQSDAKLNYVGGEVPVSWKNENQVYKSISYGIPNLNECKNCHIKGSKITPIGPTVAQLNKKYSAIKSAQNQLERFQNLGILDLPDSHPSLPKLPIWDDPKTGSIKQRANAYLDANCAHCHREQGSAKNSGLYLTYNETNMRRRGVFKPPVAAGKGSGNLEYSIVPGNPEESILIYRMKNNDPAIRMPEIGRVSAHKEGIALIEQYIRSLADH